MIFALHLPFMAAPLPQAAIVLALGLQAQLQPVAMQLKHEKRLGLVRFA